jgi:putative ABC transport system substrate-binding protein
MLGRRQLLALLAACVTLPQLAARAQATRHTRIGFLGAETASGYKPHIEGLRAGLRDLGYIEGKNISLILMWAEGKNERLPELARELVRLNVDVIVTHGSFGTRAAKEATSTLPIVMAASGDPVASGLVPNLVRPGGNVTGLANFSPELSGKRLDLLKDFFPHIAEVAVLLNPDNRTNGAVMQVMEATAASLKITLQPFLARAQEEMAAAFSQMTSRKVNAVVIGQDGNFFGRAKFIADLATSNRLPSVGFKEYADAGGLIGYGPNIPDMYRRAGLFIDKILKGSNPGDLAVERATKFELLVNRKSAKALGWKVPERVLMRADQVLD